MKKKFVLVTFLVAALMLGFALTQAVAKDRTYHCGTYDQCHVGNVSDGVQVDCCDGMGSCSTYHCHDGKCPRWYSGTDGVPYKCSIPDFKCFCELLCPCEGSWW